MGTRWWRRLPSLSRFRTPLVLWHDYLLTSKLLESMLKTCRWNIIQPVRLVSCRLTLPRVVPNSLPRRYAITAGRYDPDTCRSMPIVSPRQIAIVKQAERVNLTSRHCHRRAQRVRQVVDLSRGREPARASSPRHRIDVPRGSLPRCSSRY